jgi:hypothetical protein
MPSKSGVIGTCVAYASIIVGVVAAILQLRG